MKSFLLASVIIVLILSLNSSLAPSKAAISFDGVNDRIIISDSNSLDISSQLTMSAWVNGTSWADVDRKSIFIKGASYYLTVVPTGNVGIYAYGKNPPGYHLSNATLLTSTWVHVVSTIDTNGFKIFINGSLDKTIPSTGSITMTTDNLAIGVEYTGLGRYFNGYIDDVRIYNRALSGEEIEALYKSHKKRASGSLANGIVAHYEMDDDEIGSAVGTVIDVSANSNHGVGAGGASLIYEAGVLKR